MLTFKTVTEAANYYLRVYGVKRKNPVTNRQICRFVKNCNILPTITSWGAELLPASITNTCATVLSQWRGGYNGERTTFGFNARPTEGDIRFHVASYLQMRGFEIRCEVPYSTKKGKGRVDILVSKNGKPKLIIEVKASALWNQKYKGINQCDRYQEETGIKAALIACDTIPNAYILAEELIKNHLG